MLSLLLARWLPADIAGPVQTGLLPGLYVLFRTTLAPGRCPELSRSATRARCASRAVLEHLPVAVSALSSVRHRPVGIANSEGVPDIFVYFWMLLIFQKIFWWGQLATLKEKRGGVGRPVVRSNQPAGQEHRPINLGQPFGQT